MFKKTLALIVLLVVAGAAAWRVVSPTAKSRAAAIIILCLVRILVVLIKADLLLIHPRFAGRSYVGPTIALNHPSLMPVQNNADPGRSELAYKTGFSPISLRAARKKWRVVAEIHG